MLSSIDRIELGNDTDTRELHLKKQELPIEVTEGGIEIVKSLEHPKKQLFPIRFNEEGKWILVKEVQQENV